MLSQTKNKSSLVHDLLDLITGMWIKVASGCHKGEKGAVDRVCNTKAWVILENSGSRCLDKKSVCSIDTVVDSINVMKVLALFLQVTSDKLKRKDLRILFQLVEEEVFDSDLD